jgi:hypothetical protein
MMVIIINLRNPLCDWNLSIWKSCSLWWQQNVLPPLRNSWPNDWSWNLTADTASTNAICFKAIVSHHSFMTPKFLSWLGQLSVVNVCIEQQHFVAVLQNKRNYKMWNTDIISTDTWHGFTVNTVILSHLEKHRAVFLTLHNIIPVHTVHSLTKSLTYSHFGTSFQNWFIQVNL